MTLQSLHGSLVSHCHTSFYLVGRVLKVAQGVVVDGKGTLGAEESRDVSVVSVRDSLAVEGLLNKLAHISVGLTAQGIVIS